MKTPTTKSSDTTSIWVTSEYRLTVDSHGVVKDPCYMGAFGCVIQLQTAATAGRLGRRSAAMKIPRLTCDTVQENAFVNSTLRAESEVARHVAAHGRERVIKPLENSQYGVLRGPRSLKANKDGRTQDNGYLFVQFRGNEFPRICNVKLDSAQSSLDVTPPDCQETLARVVSVESFKQVISEFESGERQDASWYWVDSRTPTSAPNAEQGKAASHGRHGELDSALSPGFNASVWYVGLPAIIYPWATGTLQEAIATNKISGWTVNDHYQLADSILKGVHELHRDRLIHADIRPANILCIGNLSTPDDYVVADYGSFTEGVGGSERSPDEHSDNTLRGPGVDGPRSSPFYAPERRRSTESEGADTAAIVEASNRKEWLVILGWKKEIVDPATGRLRDEILKDVLANSAKRRTAESPDRSIRKGDKIRVGRRLLTVEACMAGPAKSVVLACDGKIWEVVYDRIAVRASHEAAELKDSQEELVSLSAFFHYCQWSAATDIYGVGATLLYAVMASGFDADKEHPVVGDNAPFLAFRELIRVLESVPFFQGYWSELGSFVRHFEAGVESNSLDAPELIRNAEDTFLLLSQTAPHIDKVAYAFGRNRADLLVFMHFMLACLHRQDDLDADGRKGEYLPFCKDRTERPREHGAADAARKRLGKVRHLLGVKKPDSYSAAPNAILKFDPQSTFKSQLDNQRLKRHVEQLGKELATLRTQAKASEQYFSELTALMERREAQIQQLHATIATHEKDRGEATVELRTKIRALEAAERRAADLEGARKLADAKTQDLEHRLRSSDQHLETLRHQLAEELHRARSRMDALEQIQSMAASATFLSRAAALQSIEQIAMKAR